MKNPGSQEEGLGEASVPFVLGHPTTGSGMPTAGCLGSFVPGHPRPDAGPGGPGGPCPGDESRGPQSQASCGGRWEMPLAPHGGAEKDNPPRVNGIHDPPNYPIVQLVVQRASSSMSRAYAVFAGLSCYADCHSARVPCPSPSFSHLLSPQAIGSCVAPSRGALHTYCVSYIRPRWGHSFAATSPKKCVTISEHLFTVVIAAVPRPGESLGRGPP